MIAGRDRLLAGDATGASDAFTQAEDAFSEAAGRLGNPLTRVASFVPIVGRTPDAVVAGADAGVLIARAGKLVAGAAEELPGGLGALAPRNGVIPIGPLNRLAEPLATARDLAERARTLIARAPRTLVPSPVRRSVEVFDEQLTEARTALTAGAALARALPVFLGQDGPRTYFVGAQNPAELRGTGGLIGVYSILTASRGRLSFEPFRDVLTLSTAGVSGIEPPNPDFERIYARFGSTGNWSNVNMTGDTPSAATAIERLYQTATSETVDGTILADPVALAELLEATGPVRLEGRGITLDAQNVVPFVTNEAYTMFRDSASRKRILGDVAGDVLARFVSGESDPSDAGRALVEAGAGGHLVLHAADPEVQSSLRAAGVAGDLGGGTGDYLGVVLNSGSGSKIDYYLDRRITYDVLLGPGGSAMGTASITLGNDAPADGQPAYVIGPHPFLDTEAGDNVLITSVLCARSCDVTGFRRQGGPDTIVEEDRELGHPLILGGLTIPSGATDRLTYEWTAGAAWDAHGDEGTYRLTIRTQPGIRPARIEVAVTAPPGFDIVAASPGMQVQGGRATWLGTAGAATRLEVRLTRPILYRLAPILPLL